MLHNYLDSAITTIPALFVSGFKNIIWNSLTALVKPLATLRAVSHVFFLKLRKSAFTIYCHLFLAYWSCSSDHLRWKRYKLSFFDTLKQVWSHFLLLVPEVCRI